MGPGIKTLESILLDGTESDYIRANALMSLKSIGTKETEQIMDFEKSGDKDVLKLTEGSDGNSR